MEGDFWNSVEIGMFLELAFTPAERNFEEKNTWNSGRKNTGNT
jgi:hypothetical protein